MHIELIEIDSAVAKCPECRGKLWWDGASQSIVCVNSDDSFHRNLLKDWQSVYEKVKQWLRGSI